MEGKYVVKEPHSLVMTKCIVYVESRKNESYCDWFNHISVTLIPPNKALCIF